MYLRCDIGQIAALRLWERAGTIATIRQESRVYLLSDLYYLLLNLRYGNLTAFDLCEKTERLVETIHANHHWAGCELNTTEPLDGILSIFLCGESNGTPALGAARILVVDHFSILHGSDLLEGSPEHVTGDVPGQVTNDNLLSSRCLWLVDKGWITLTLAALAATTSSAATLTLAALTL